MNGVDGAFGSTNGKSSQPDIWGLSGVTSKCSGIGRWFIPSDKEWAAFGYNLGITKENYDSKYGLSDYYWSSSLYADAEPWEVNFKQGYMIYSPVTGGRYVRLSTIF